MCSDVLAKNLPVSSRTVMESEIIRNVLYSSSIRNSRKNALSSTVLKISIVAIIIIEMFRTYLVLKL